MKILLCSLFDVGASLGIKSLYHSVKQAGYQTKLLFYDTPRFGENEKQPFQETIHFPTHIPLLKKKDMELFKEILRAEKPEIIGFSLLSAHFKAAKRLSEEARSVSDAIIVWGGTHPIIDPRSCLPYADYICTGEAEEVFLKLVNAIVEKDMNRPIPGIWDKDSIRDNRTQEWVSVKDLNRWHFGIIDQKDVIFVPKNRPQIIWSQEKAKNTPYHSAQYITMTSRGCPMSCKFCINGYLYTKTAHKNPVRQRSVEHVIKELIEVKRSRRLHHVTFMDDFFPQDKIWLKQFAEEYSRNIKLPFFCNFYPGQVNNEAVDLLVNSGLLTANIGIQSGSHRIRKDIFGRPETNTQILKAAKLLNPRVQMRYELICDNPFETKEDVRKTLDLMLQLPMPFSVMTFSLTYFPNYPITELAQEKGFIDGNQIYEELDRDFTTSRRATDPVIRSLYYLITAAPHPELKRTELYRWSQDRNLLENPELMKKHLFAHLS